MRKFMNRLAIASLVALPIAAAVATVPAGASAGTTHFRLMGIHALVSPNVSPNIPNANIVGNGKKATYNPDKLKYKAQDSDPCAAPVSFNITNTGTKTANVTVNGSPFFSLPAGDQEGICGDTPAGEVDTFGLSNASGSKIYAGTLTVTSKG